MSQSNRRYKLAGKAACVMLGSLLAACASNRGLVTQAPIEEAVNNAVDPMVADQFAIPLPAPAPAPAEPVERFDIDVRDVAAEDLFMSLVEGTDESLIVHPDVSGQVSLSLKQVSVVEVLDTMRDVYGYDYRRNAAGYILLPATLQGRVFEIDYLNLTREGRSRPRVSSGQVSPVAQAGANQRTAGGGVGVIPAGGARQSRPRSGRCRVTRVTSAPVRLPT